jgi:membrane fusion protein, multidrug efflux system
MPVPARALALCLALAACSSGQSQDPRARGPVEVGYVTLTASASPVSTELTGRVTATLTADVRPQVDGVIRQRLFEEGSYVHVGQPLYQIDARSYSASRDQIVAQLENAQATLATSEAKAKRYATLRDVDAVSRQDIDDAIASAQQARANIHLYQANLRAAKLNLEFTRVLAPISGRIGRSSVTPGALVTASQTTALATIQQLDPVFVDITESSDQLLALRKRLANGSMLPSSAAVRLKLSDGSLYPQPGKIEFSEVSVDQDAGTVVLRARFANPDGLLMPGMFVRVETPEGIIPNAVLAPQQGITRDPKGTATALVLDGANKVVKRQVTTLKAVGDQWIVTQGLKPGDKLIVQGTDKAAPGATVKAVAVKIGG